MMKKSALLPLGLLTLLTLLFLAFGLTFTAAMTAADGPSRPQASSVVAERWASRTVGPEAAWRIEVVDSANNVGKHTAIALDATGRPRISYYDVTFGDLKYAFYSDAWYPGTLDSGGDVGWFTSLALDAADRPHISYYDFTQGDLKYTYYDGASWHPTTVDSNGYAGLYSSLALDAAGRPHIAYVADTVSPYPEPTPPTGLSRAPVGQPEAPRALRYAWFDGSSWHIDALVADIGADGGHTSLDLDSAGRPHIAYYDALLGGLRYARFDGSSWTYTTVESGLPGLYASLKLDDADHPHISYYDASAADLKYAYHDGATWHIGTVDSTGDVGRYTSLALDAAGLARISYLDFTSSSLKYASFDGSTWQIEVVDNAAAVGGYTSLALDARGWPHISYYDYTSGDLKYACWRCFGLAGVSIAGPTFLVVNDTGLYTATTTPPTATVPLTILWDNGTLGANAAYSWTLPGLYTIAVTASNYCSTVSDTLEVEVCQPVEETAVSGPDFLRTGEMAMYTAIYTPSNASMPLDFRWDNGSTGQTAAYSWTLPGIYTVTVTTTNACGQTIGTKEVQVCQAVESLTLDGPANLLTGQEGLYTATTFPGNADPSTIIWDNGSSGPTAIYSWTLPGNYTIHATATNACGEVYASLPVAVCQPVESLFLSGPADLLTGQEGLYTATTFPGNADPVTIIWDNHSSGPTAIYSWTLPGNYTIHATATNACGEVYASLPVAVCQPVESAFITGPVELRTGQSGLYTATYVPDNASGPVTFTWDNGTIGPNATYSWDLPGIYTIYVTITGDCGEAYGALVVEVCQAVENLTLDGPAELLTGQEGLYTATVEPANADPPVSIVWDNGSGGPTAVYSWMLPGTYTIHATATNACGEVYASLSVAVCQPVVEAAVDGPETLRPGEVGFYSAVYTPSNSSLPVSILWDNGTIGYSAAYSWSVTGTHTIRVTVTNPCNQLVLTHEVNVAYPAWHLYLPIQHKSFDVRPDLLVTAVHLNPAAPAELQVGIRNQGTTAALNFWIDGYLDPPRPPEQNETWSQLGCPYGVAWYVPALQPGQALTLTIGDIYFRPAYSNWPLAFSPGKHAFWAYVDSWGPPQPYGAVAERDESNNRFGPVEFDVLPPAAPPPRPAERDAPR